MKSIEPEVVFNILNNLANQIFDTVIQQNDTDRRKAGVKKGHYYIDELAQEILEKELYPLGAQIISEESSTHFKGIENKELSGLTIVVDPIDGTANASRGRYDWAFSVLVKDEKGPWLGFVKHQISKAIYLAIRDKGAYKTNDSIYFSDENKLVKKNKGDGDSFHIGLLRVGEKISLENKINEIFETNSKPVVKHRILGAAAIQICEVAQGASDAFLHNNFCVFGWDCFGAIMVAKEAGCIVEFKDDLVFEDLIGDEKVFVNVY